jgi:hypothetical protein
MDAVPEQLRQTTINFSIPTTNLPERELTVKQQVRNIYTDLYFNAGVSARSIPKILKTFNEKFSLQLDWIPHYTSAINWCLYLGLGLLTQVKPIEKDWVAIIDHSIGIGPNKVLVVLRMLSDVISTFGRAIRLEDCKCIGLKVVETVNGETTAADLTEIFAKSGNPSIVIRDCDATLKKGVSRWAQAQDLDIPIIEDIGHVVGSGLKAEFEKNADFKTFISLLGKGAKRLRQTMLAFLLPPKLRTKGRFQGVACLTKWAKKVLPIFSSLGRARKGSTLDKLRTAFPDFIQLKRFITRFSLAADVTSQMMKVLKTQGLTPQTHDECRQLLAQLPKHSKTRQRLEKWLDTHNAISERPDDEPTMAILVSSDIIESLFGRFKYFLERGPRSGITRSVLLIPGMCGIRNDIEVAQTRELIRHRDLQEWDQINLPSTIAKDRRQFFQGNNSEKMVA